MDKIKKLLEELNFSDEYQDADEQGHYTAYTKDDENGYTLIKIYEPF